MMRKAKYERASKKHHVEQSKQKVKKGNIKS